jgi:hypothetical protein
LRICTLRGIDYSQGAPKPPDSLGCPLKCTWETNREVMGNCL